MAWLLELPQYQNQRFWKKDAECDFYAVPGDSSLQECRRREAPVNFVFGKVVRYRNKKERHLIVKVYFYPFASQEPFFAVWMDERLKVLGDLASYGAAIFRSGQPPFIKKPDQTFNFVTFLDEEDCSKSRLAVYFESDF